MESLDEKRQNKTERDDFLQKTPKNLFDFVV